MIPRPAEAVAHICTRIGTDLIPKAVDDYVQTDLAFLTFMISMLGQDFERVVDVLMKDHEEVLAIFERARPHLSADLIARIDQVLARPSPGYRVTPLIERGDLEMRIFIDLHEAVEDAAASGQAWAVALDRDIWQVLDGYAERRAYEIPF